MRGIEQVTFITRIKLNLSDEREALSFLLTAVWSYKGKNLFFRLIYVDTPKCNVAPEHVCCILNICSHLRLPKVQKYMHSISKLKPDISSNNSQLVQSYGYHDTRLKHTSLSGTLTSRTH